MMAKINFTSDAIDIGIVTTNDIEMLNFYQNVLGLKKEVEIPFPGLGLVNKLSFGSGYIKILVLENDPTNINPTGNFSTSNGIRYVTINLSNLDEILESCDANNINIINPGTVIRPGVTVAIIQDPDGNLLELMQSK
jgi:catechol 2,3-dioxygenase-like lactoylglutathione lyase family enzyme